MKSLKPIGCKSINIFSIINIVLYFMVNHTFQYKQSIKHVQNDANSNHKVYFHSMAWI